MNLKVNKESNTGLNTEFINVDSGRKVTLEHAIEQIQKGNPNYSDYQTVSMHNGTTYIRSRANDSKADNIE